MADILTNAERTALVAALAFCRASFDALDNSETVDGAANISEPWLSTAIERAEALEALPDDKPGYTLSAPAKAWWALRRLVGDPVEEVDAYEPVIRGHPEPGDELAEAPDTAAMLNVGGFDAGDEELAGN